MFLLVSVRHVGAHPGGHQHGGSIQISINLGKTFLQISRIRNIPLTWILAGVFVYLPSFISQISDFIYRTVFIIIIFFIFLFIYFLISFVWRDTENLACVASVSVRFRSKERRTRVTRFISRAVSAKNPVPRPRSFFAPKPSGNACYAGYWKPAIVFL